MSIEIKHRNGTVLYSGEYCRFREAIEAANLRGADLRGANLRGADLRGADLQEANLRGADLQEANLRGANLHGANLQEADLQEANLHEANLQGANLYGAKGIAQIGPMPTSGRFVFLVKHEAGTMVQASCFWGNIFDFRQKIKEDHNSETYLLVADMAEKWEFRQ